MKYKLPVVCLAAVLAIAFLSCSRKSENIISYKSGIPKDVSVENMGLDHTSDQSKSSDIPDDDIAGAYIPEAVTDTESDSSAVIFSSEEKALNTSHTISMKYILQNPELPTGCEVTALTMVLNYMGFDVTKTELASKYLKTASLGNAGFDEAFIGNPASDGGYGCFAPVIVETAQKYLVEKTLDITAWDISGTEFKELFRLVSEDKPVIVWASMNLMEVTVSDAYFDGSGNSVKWFDNEHCMVLCGYDFDENVVIAADPLKGLMKYDMDRFENIYNTLNRQAVVIE